VNVTNAWNIQLFNSSGAQLGGGNMSYNGSLAPGQSVSFGLQGTPGDVDSPTCNAEP